MCQKIVAALVFNYAAWATQLLSFYINTEDRPEGLW